MTREQFVIRTRVSFVEADWVRFEGSRERMHLTDHNFVVGEPIIIVIRRPDQPEASNANP